MKGFLLTLFLILCGTSMFYAQIEVSGTITSKEDGETLPGVSVVEKGTTNGVVTDVNGKYTISVKNQESVLMYSFIGMQMKEEVVGRRTQINPALSSSITDIESVMVTALGVKKEEKTLGYSAQQISGQDAIEAGNPNPIAGLQGKVAGVQVIQASGTPGASAKILIRGNATFGANQPLIVVDGIPIDNSTGNTYSSNVGGVDQSNRAMDINPDDIASVTVLKGAAATALYGSRAGNGVILYTTKGGSNTEGKLIGSFSTGVNFTNPINMHEQQQKFGQSVGAYSWGDPVKDDEIFDNVNDYFRTGVSQEHNLSLAGGNQTSQVRASVGHTNAEGIIPNSNWKRTSIRVSANTKFTDRLSFNSSVSLTKTGGNRPQKGSNLAGVMLSLYRTPIDFDLKSAYEENHSNDNYFEWYDNPYYSAFANTYVDNVWRTMGYGSLLVDLNKKEGGFFNSLDLTLRTGIDSYSDARKAKAPIGSNSVDDKKGFIMDYQGNFQELNNDVILRGSKTTEEFGFDFTLGANSRNLKDEYQRTEGLQLSEDGFYNIANAKAVTTSQYTTLINEYSLYFDMTASWKRMLYLGLSGRNEWSSKYEMGSNNNFFPSTNVAFIFTELFDGGKIGPLSFGKLRGSFGQTGIAPLPWRYASYTQAVNVGDGYTAGNTTDASGAFLTNWGAIQGNQNLRPEILSGMEVGMDLRFWEGRLTFDLAYYHQTTRDLLIQVPVSSVTGFISNYQNIGEMVNQGIELSIGSDVVRTKDFTWNTSLNYGRNRNEVTKLADGVEEIALAGGFTSISAYARKDEPFGVMYGETWQKDDNGNLLIASNGLPILNPEREKVGNPYPKFNLGWRNTVSYKDWSLGFFFDGFFGADVYNGTKAMMNFRGIGKETEDREGKVVIEGVSSTDGQPNTIEISKENYWKYYRGIGGASEQFIENVNFVRLRNVSLTYNLKFGTKVLNSIDNLTVSAIGTNLLTFTNYSQGDPETSLTGAASNTQGFDYFNSPNVRGFMIKLSTNF